MVTTLAQDLSWLQVLTTKQSFYWGIIASCCEKIPITEKKLEWVHLYESLITCLGHIYNSYCKCKRFSVDECLPTAKKFTPEITHSSSEHIMMYELN